MQRVRGRTPESGSYAADYDTLARLKEFSDTCGVALLLVHHMRKEGAEDVFNTISGTNGLMGAADGALILHKGAPRRPPLPFCRSPPFCVPSFCCLARKNVV